MNAPGEDAFVFLDPPYDIKDFLYGTGRNFIVLSVMKGLLMMWMPARIGS